ncbi:integrase catalytic domain-containing protein [Nephila pilipes]|uniref:Integrase catalytic domain-containing protein n=1 Tax=Nephila pilipes TaxID=299642 RepID=A0A8X6MXS0_NEPPI|nr:integrase catalytic domain-containing protein [Nephila pilipes]
MFIQHLSKKVTLPHLELLAALMGTRLLKYFCEEVDIQPSAATLWTDSKITLSWIRSDPNKWKTFVCNRTTEILQYTSPAQWRHCPGTQKPADHLSRGILPSKLSNLKNWWYGPDWLTQEPSFWPSEDLTSYEQLKTDNEARKPLMQSLYVETTNPVIDITHFSSYTKLLRVTAWILRFLHICRNEQRFLFELTVEELLKTKDYWILTVQQQCFHAEMEALRNNRPLPTASKIARFNPFLKNNQIRLGGRLQFVPLSADFRHPLLLKGNHPFVLLLIKNMHVRLHHLGTGIVLYELRSDFCILRGRQAIKKVLHKCLPCKLPKLKWENQIEGLLPSERVTPSVPFSTTGIDFAGPLYVRNKSPSDAAYIALFTCATTRALHIELVSDLSTDKFLLALLRFVGRRGLPCTINTDNATTFHAANKELILLWKVITSEKIQQFYAHNAKYRRSHLADSNHNLYSSMKPHSQKRASIYRYQQPDINLLCFEKSQHCT